MRMARRRRRDAEWLLSGNVGASLNDRDGRKGAGPVLHAMAIKRDVVWPKAACLLRDSFMMKAAELRSTQVV